MNWLNKMRYTLRLNKLRKLMDQSSDISFVIPSTATSFDEPISVLFRNRPQLDVFLHSSEMRVYVNEYQASPFIVASLILMLRKLGDVVVCGILRSDLIFVDDYVKSKPQLTLVKEPQQ